MIPYSALHMFALLMPSAIPIAVRAQGLHTILFNTVRCTCLPCPCFQRFPSLLAPRGYTIDDCIHACLTHALSDSRRCWYPGITVYDSILCAAHVCLAHAFSDSHRCYYPGMTQYMIAYCALHLSALPMRSAIPIAVSTQG